MRLKAIELHGFKSFADPTRLEFPGPITAIVGPNGSGKSNIAEAIRWALGEQSLSTLRARRGEDLIFAGSDQRPRAGMAEVTLIFDNAEGWLPIDFVEVALTRRVYRDGEGEYLLNGNRVRLRDVQELLGATPLARRTYTVIGQGLVDEVLRLRPEERRALFEEAAGIALYRMKREEALRRWEATQQNLSRVRDLLAEMTPRLHSLRRQAERARQHEEILARLRERWRRWAALRLARLRGQVEAARAALAEAEAAWRQHQTQQAAAEQEALARREALRQQRALLADQEAALEALRVEVEALQRRRAEVEQQWHALLESERARQEQAAHLQARLEAIAAVRQALEAEAQALARRHQDLREQRRALEARYQAQQARRLEILRRLEAAQEALAQVRGHQEDLARRRARLQALRQELEAQALHHQARREALLRRWEGLSQEEMRWREAEAEGQRALAELEAQRIQAAQRLVDAEAAVAQAREALAQARSQYAYLRSYAEALGPFWGSGEGLRADLEAVLSAQLPGVLGPLAAWLEVAPGWEAAVAAALGPLLHAVVVRDRQALASVRARVRHGLPAVVWEALRFERPVVRRRGLAAQGRGGGLRIGPADLLPPGRVLRASEPRLQAWLEQRLEGIWFVETWEEALRIGERLPRTATLITREGERIGGDGLLWLGRYTSPEVVWLVQERERRSLPERLAEAQRALERTEAMAHAAERQYADARDRASALERALQETQARQEAIRRRLEGIRSERAAVEAALRDLEREEEKRREQEAQAEREAQEQDREEGALREREQALVEARVDLERELEALGLSDLEAELARVQAEEWLVEEALRQTQALLEQQAEAWARLEAERAAEAAVSDGAEREALEAEGARLQALLESAEARLQALEAQRGAAIAALMAAEMAFEEQWQAVESLRTAGQGLEEQVHAARLEVVRWEGELRAFQQALREEWQRLEGEGELDLEGLGSEEPEADAGALEALEAEVAALRQALRRLGPIHPEAAAEYAALQERHAFLTAQVADLEAAASDLRRTVEALDREMEQAFVETFRAVGRAFKETFVALFGGGNARLSLTEAPSWDQAGVEVFVRVPGKRTQNLLMLSGGEKALTATALIFAILQVRPSPFVVLDEADAALDEANIGRFREMIRRLSERTQFILITHNRGTVEAADVLYGVTLRADGTSQVLSLRLEEAERMLARK